MVGTLTGTAAGEGGGIFTWPWECPRDTRPVPSSQWPPSHQYKIEHTFYTAAVG